eukprot:21382-Heterococcus_DN1.PRE.2
MRSTLLVLSCLSRHRSSAICLHTAGDLCVSTRLTQEAGYIATLTKHAVAKLSLDALRSLYFTDTLLHSADCFEHIIFTTLHSDGNYIAQNAARVARALFEITLRKGWSSVARSLLQLSKAIDRRAWWFQSPLRQFSGELPVTVYENLESKGGVKTSAILDMNAKEVGALSGAHRLGEKV